MSSRGYMNNEMDEMDERKTATSMSITNKSKTKSEKRFKKVSTSSNPEKQDALETDYSSTSNT